MLKELHDKINGVCALILMAILCDVILSAMIVFFVAKYSTG